MKFGRILTITLAALLATVPTAQAQDEDLGELTTRKPARKQTAAEEELADPARKGVYLGAGAVYAMSLFDGDGVDADDSGGFNVHAGYRFHPRVAGGLHVESYQKFDAESITGPSTDVGDVNGWAVGGDVRGYILTGKWQPYVLLGLNYLDMETNFSGNTKQDDGVAMRFGIGTEVYVFQRVAVTADISYLLGTGEVDEFSLVAFSLGFLFRP